MHYSALAISKTPDKTQILRAPESIQNPEGAPLKLSLSGDFDLDVHSSQTFTNLWT
jgi:hypothetical protein